MTSTRSLRLVAAKLEGELRSAGGAERAENEKRYLKSELEHFGTPVPVIRKLTKAAIKTLDVDRQGGRRVGPDPLVGAYPRASRGGGGDPVPLRRSSAGGRR